MWSDNKGYATMVTEESSAAERVENADDIETPDADQRTEESKERLEDPGSANMRDVSAEDVAEGDEGQSGQGDEEEGEDAKGDDEGPEGKQDKDEQPEGKQDNDEQPEGKEDHDDRSDDDQDDEGKDRD
jgi:hypothetical protein